MKCETAILVVPYQTISVIRKDEEDNRILECALEGKAHYIGSEDKCHLLSLKNIKV